MQNGLVHRAILLIISSTPTQLICMARMMYVIISFLKLTELGRDSRTMESVDNLDK